MRACLRETVDKCGCVSLRAFYHHVHVFGALFLVVVVSRVVYCILRKILLVSFAASAAGGNCGRNGKRKARGTTHFYLCIAPASRLRRSDRLMDGTPNRTMLLHSELESHSHTHSSVLIRRKNTPYCSAVVLSRRTHVRCSVHGELPAPLRSAAHGVCIAAIWVTDTQHNTTQTQSRTARTCRGLNLLSANL